MLKLILPLLCLLGIGLLPVSAGEPPFPYSSNDTFEEKVPSPGDWFGVALGDRFTPHHEVLAYCQEVAKLSSRVRIQEYGRSAEGRELVLLMMPRHELAVSQYASRDVQPFGVPHGEVPALT